MGYNPDTMTSYAIPTGLNAALSASLTAALVFQLIILPLWLADHALAMTALAGMLIVLNMPYWSLIHEAIHNNLHPDRRANMLMARGMSILFGASFPVLRFGHLMHHQYNRTWESEFYDPHQTAAWRAWLNHYFKMLGGIYLIEVGTSFAIALTPRPLMKKAEILFFPDEKHRQAVSNALLKPKTVRAIRLDCLVIIGVYGLSALLYGAHWPILALILAGRAVIISIMDNAYHYGTPLDNSVAAKELRLPPPCEKFVLYFNHHLTHHHNTAAPWTALGEQQTRQANPYTQGLIPALIAQFKGPIKHP